MPWYLRILPLPLLFLLAALAVGALAVAHAHFEWQKRLASEAGVPNAIPVAEVGKVRSFPWFDETHIQVQTHNELFYLYWEETADGTIEYPIIFLIDPSYDGTVEDVREVYGALAFDSFEADEMMAYLERVNTGQGALGNTYDLNGTRAFAPIVTYEEVEFAAAELGLTMSPNFIYIDPFIEGRDARLTPQPMITYVLAGAAMVLLWLSIVIGIIKRGMRRSEEAVSARNTAVRKGVIGLAIGSVKALVVGDDDDEALI